LVALPAIGTDAQGNPNVTVTGGSGEFDIAWKHALASTPIALLSGNVSSLRSNGVHADLTLDGEGGSDTYEVNLIGGRTASIVNGTDNADVFLLRAATADDGLAFIALINGPTPLTPAASDPVERINYNQNLESI